MTNALALLAGRALGLPVQIRPRLAVRFEPTGNEAPADAAAPLAAAGPVVKPTSSDARSPGLPRGVVASASPRRAALVRADAPPLREPPLRSEIHSRSEIPASRDRRGPTAAISERSEAAQPPSVRIASLDIEALPVTHPAGPPVAAPRTTGLPPPPREAPPPPPVFAPLLPAVPVADRSPTPAAAPGHARRGVAPEPVTITIGRIEIRAEPPRRPPATAPAPRPPRSRAMSLEDHLGGRRS